MTVNFIVVYNCIIVILQLSFDYESTGGQLTFDTIVEFVFVLDIVF